MHAAVLEAVGVREDLIGLRRVRHVFLDAEVRHAQIEVQRRAHAHRREVGGSVAAGAHAIEIGEVGDPPQMGDPAGVDHRGADVVDQLLLDQLLASQMELNTSPTASGVVVCWRISRNASWFSAGVASSSQNSRYGSRLLPSAPPRSASGDGARRAAA